MAQADTSPRRLRDSCLTGARIFRSLRPGIIEQRDPDPQLLEEISVLSGSDVLPKSTEARRHHYFFRVKCTFQRLKRAALASPIAVIPGGHASFSSIVSLDSQQNRPNELINPSSYISCACWSSAWSLVGCYSTRPQVDLAGHLPPSIPICSLLLHLLFSSLHICVLWAALRLEPPISLPGYIS